MDSASHLGLRDRKRAQTRSRIEAAAVRLVLRDGLEATTVDAISERAEVSPRTFFNYFDTKDAAILGVTSVDTTERYELRPSEDLIVSIVRMLLGAMGVTPESDASAHRDRLEVIRRHPHVVAGQLAQLSARASRLTAAIEQLMSVDERFASLADRGCAAELLLSLCGAAIRAAIRAWATDEPAAPVHRIEQRAIALIEELIGRLA